MCWIPAYLMSEGFCHCICEGSCVGLQRGNALCGLGYIVCQLLLLGAHILDCGCHAVQLGVLLGQRGVNARQLASGMLGSPVERVNQELSVAVKILALDKEAHAAGAGCRHQCVSHFSVSETVRRHVKALETGKQAAG